MLYLLDANVLIDANRDYYPRDRFPEFWDWLLYLAEREQVKIPPEMYEEVLGGRTDNLTSWVKHNKEVLLLDEQVDELLVAHVTEKGYAPDLDDQELVRLGQDPFLIAHACRDPSHRKVVTTEVSKPKRIRANRHIPDVCGDLGVHCCNTFELIVALNFTTGWSRRT